MLNRDEMERVIREGGSVLYQGVIITRIVDLPHAATLAQGDTAQENAVRADLDAQIAALAVQRAQLGGGAGAQTITGVEETMTAPPHRGTQIGGGLEPVAAPPPTPASDARKRS